jgi:hypothetical protein
MMPDMGTTHRLENSTRTRQLTKATEESDGGSRGDFSSSFFSKANERDKLNE